MKNLIFIILTAFVVISAGCSHTDKKQQTPTDTVVVNKAIATHDSLIVQGRWIIFYQPSHADYEEMERNGIDNSFYSLASQFGTYRDVMIDSLKKTDWADKIQVTDRRCLIVRMNNGQQITFDKTKADELVGFIMVDGKQQPAIEPGVSTDKAWWGEVTRYFGK